MKAAVLIATAFGLLVLGAVVWTEWRRARGLRGFWIERDRKRREP